MLLRHTCSVQRAKAGFELPLKKEKNHKNQYRRSRHLGTCCRSEEGILSTQHVTRRGYSRSIHYPHRRNCKKNAEAEPSLMRKHESTI
jgi:hypothetical protein